MYKPKISILGILVIILMIIELIPLYVMLIGSFKPNFALFAIPPNLNPLKIIPANYKYVFTNLDIARWYGNSLFISAMISLITVTVAATAGYAFAKHNFFGKGFWFAVLMATMMLPRQILMVPNFMVAKNFGLIDKLMGVVLTSIPASFGVFMCKQFMSTLPNEMMEAAKIDGCSEIKTFIEIILPLSGPVLGALAIFSFVGGWNDFIWQNIILTTKDNRTMPLAIAFLSQERISYVGYQMAGATLSAIPMIAIFVKFQKYFIRGLTVGSVKG